MERFFGMMPSSEVSISKRYENKNGFELSIEAGTHGWTIIYADSSSQYADVDATADDNFDAAYSRAVERVGDLIEVNTILVPELP